MTRFRGPLWCLEIATRAEAEDAFSELLARIFQQTPVSYTDIESLRTTVTVYLLSDSHWDATRKRQFLAGVERIKESGLEPGKVRIRFKKLAADWRESWKRHFKALEIGPRLLIKPSWSRKCPKNGQGVVVIDPGLSFGTGHHPTTAFCLEQLARRRDDSIRQSALDIGTGSGILAIAAAKLGYAPVDAIDLDEEALSTARANARRNRVLRRISFHRRDVTRLGRRPRRAYTLVCANLVSSLLVNEREKILGRVAPGGVLVAAGILRAEFAEVQKAYESAGLRLIASRVEGEWRSGSFKV